MAFFRLGLKKDKGPKFLIFFIFCFFFLVLRVNLLRRYFISVCFFFLLIQQRSIGRGGGETRIEKRQTFNDWKDSSWLRDMHWTVNQALKRQNYNQV